MGKNLYDLAIDQITEKYKAELMDEVIKDVNPQFEEEKIDEMSFNFYSLSDIPFDKIQDFKVSKLSTYKDILWDWRQEGSQIYKDDCFFSWDKEVSEGVSLIANENKYLCRLLKMIAFYSLPQNACLQNVKSFNTSKAILKQLQSLGKFLYKHRLFIDIQGNGSFTNTVYLTKEHFTDFIKNDLKEPGAVYNFAKQVKHWAGLSKSKLIPVDYRLNFEPFDADMYSKMAKEAEDNKGEYLPISIDTLSELVPYCIENIEKKSAEVLKIYSILWPVIAGGDNAKIQSFEWGKAIYNLLNMDLKILDLQIFKFTDYSQVTMSRDLNNKLRTAVKNHPEWNKHNSIYTSNIWKLKHSEVINIALELEIELESIDIAIVYDVFKIKIKAMELVTELRNSCVVILFLVTGMRNSEMYLLEAGNCWQVKGSEDDFRIRITIFKTSEGSTGDPIVLPVPAIAYKAFKCLEALTEKARIWGKSKKLMVSSTTNFGKEILARSINQFLGRWCEDLGIEHIHPHQFRKTIAMFAIYQNPNNISVIRRLFSHKSLAMTLSYIVKMPGMAEEMKLAVIERNKELLSELLEALDKKCIAGVAGNRIKRLVEESTIFKAKLNDDGWEGLEQYIQILLQDGLNILHRTSFGAICTNTHSGLVHLAPESCNCNVTDCNWSVFTVKSVEDLEDTINFHANFIKDDYCSESQKRFSNKTIRDCIERLYELKGIDYVKWCFPDLVSENFLTSEAGGIIVANKILKHDEALKLVYSVVASLRDSGKEKITITEVSEISEVSRATIYSKHPDWVEVRDVIKSNKPSSKLKLASTKNYEQTKWQIEAQRLEGELRICQEKLDFISGQADNVFKKLLDELHKYMHLAKKTPEQIGRETNTLIELNELKDRCEFYETEIKRLKIDSGRNTNMVPFVKKEIIDVYSETQRANISNLDLLELTYDSLLNLNNLFSKSYPPNVVYVLCGNFASGKSSWIADHKPQNVGSVVYFDGTNHTQSIRRMILKYIRNQNSDCKIVCVRILCDTRECLERNVNESRIRLKTTIPSDFIIRFAEKFEEVSVNEGFNEIIIGGGVMSESGRIKGANNVKAFIEFIKLHNQQDDWLNYLNPSNEKLRRSHICEECGFSKSALRQNPLLKDMLKNLELELLQKGVLRNKSLQQEELNYPDQNEFVKSYNEKLMKLRDSIDMVDKMIALYQLELERLD